MISMTHNGLIEHRGYYFHLFTDVADGRWIGWNTFEKKSDFDEMKHLVRSVRHRVPGSFASRDEALAACRAHALDMIDREQVGL